jgi:type I restriction enzyme S subunit
MDLDDIAYADAEFHNSIYPRCNPELGDILLTKDGANTGNVTINTIAEPFSLLSSVCLIKTDVSRLLPKVLLYYIQSDAGFEHITGEYDGSCH